MPMLAALPFALALLQAASAPSPMPPNDALALLNEVSQRYADAKSYHIEGVEEETSTTELSRHWDKRLLTAIMMPDGHYRYEGRSGVGGEALLVSDGTTRWNYHPEDHLYTQQTASDGAADNNPWTGRAVGQEEMTAYNAKFLVDRLAHTADRLKAATFLPDETISVNGKGIACYVVHYFDDPSEHSHSPRENTAWIDKSRKVVLKTFSRGESYRSTSAGGTVPMSEERTMTYLVMELDQQEPDSSFRFLAPSDAKSVSEFPNHFSAKTQTAERVDLTGKPAPDVQLKSLDGKMTTLGSFHGKPVFVEFWATWCIPCVELMPELAKLHAETVDKGLVWVSIDSDKDSQLAEKFLAREHIALPNYHDLDGSYGKAFHREGIPLGVLVDSSGTIVFDKSGYGIADLRGAIAKLGPEFSSVASSGGAAPSAK